MAAHFIVNLHEIRKLFRSVALVTHGSIRMLIGCSLAMLQLFQQAIGYQAGEQTEYTRSALLEQSTGSLLLRTRIVYLQLKSCVIRSQFGLSKTVC